jgi:phosphohistidine swiveling domain-containing protein
MANWARQHGTLDEADLDAFITRFGHRGVNELDPTMPVWESQRPHLRNILERMIGTAPDDPALQARQAHQRARAALARLPRLRRQQVAADTAVARRFSVLGERSKSDAALHVNQIRRSLDELAHRNANHHDPADIPMLSWDELRVLSCGDRTIEADTTARRLALYGARPPPATTAGRPIRTLHGVAASPGLASGTAVVVHDPTDDLPVGEVLVAHATDTAWTPLFLGMAAVVTDTGGVLSHSSIVARDLGIPAVVGTGIATRTLRTGDHTRVDGDHGRVDVLH